ncbi:MAG TPA: hypothetical protein VHB21_10310, partial [Minicystis sp.]|nr:hypothetical protein [Minicystis sp.]
ISGHTTVEEMSPAPMALRAPPVGEGSRPATALAPSGRPVSADMLLAEADRLAIEAVRRSEEAKTAAARAERKAQQAKLAGEAALVAAEAVRLAQSAGLAAAAARLDEAHELERRMASGAPGDGPSGSRGSVVPPPPFDSAVSQGRPLSVPPQSMPPFSSMPPSQPAFGAPSSSMPPGSAQLSVPPSRAPYSLDPSASGDNRPSLDPSAFQARVKPSVFGVSGPVLALLAAVAFGVAFLVLWLIFG